MHKKLLIGKMLGIIVVLLVLFMAAGVAEEERTDAGGQWKYVLEDGGATIYGFVEEPKDELTIPAELDGYPVIGIDVETFMSCQDLTVVTIPNSVWSIDHGAFQSCAGLTDVLIPPSVRSIGEDVFYGCKELTLSVTEGSFAEQYADYYEIPYITIAMTSHSLKTINVSTAEEFIDAIGPYTTIVLADGVYNLSRFDPGKVIAENPFWSYDDEDELHIHQVSSLTIQGTSSDCWIVVESPYATVLTFVDCANLQIESITAGHTPQSEYCSAGVFSFSDCENIQICNTHMFGCGATGLYLDEVRNASIADSSIYECTDDIMNIWASNDITFTNCIFRDTMFNKYAVQITGTKNLLIDNCQFINNRTKTDEMARTMLFSCRDSYDIIVKNTSFRNNSAGDLDPSLRIALSFQNNTFSSNSFD